MAGTGTGFERDMDSFGRTAGEDISNRHRFVNLDSNAEAVVAGAGEDVIGVTYNSPDSGETADVHYLGIAKVEAGGSVSAGDKIASDANGKAVTATAATADTTTSSASHDISGDQVVGIALEDLSSGEIGPVMLLYSGLV